MKVYLGPYKNWWIGPYQIADSLKYIGVSEDKRYEIGKRMPKWVSTACEFIYKHNPLAKRQLHVKIDNYDTWSMDNSLAYIILPMLKQLKATKNGIPYPFSEIGGECHNTQAHFEFYETNEELFAKAEQRWNDVLDKMIFAFEHLVDDSWENAYSTGDFDNSIEIGEPGWIGTHKCDYKGLRKVHDQIQEGLELFGKYYRNLWD